MSDQWQSDRSTGEDMHLFLQIHKSCRLPRHKTEAGNCFCLPALCPHVSHRLFLLDCLQRRAFQRERSALQTTKRREERTLPGPHLKELNFDHDYSLLTQGRCLPDSETPCWEPINKRWEGWFLEHFASTTAPFNPQDGHLSKNPLWILTLFSCLPRERMLVNSQGSFWLVSKEGPLFFWKRNQKHVPEAAYENYNPFTSSRVAVYTQGFIDGLLSLYRTFQRCKLFQSHHAESNCLTVAPSSLGLGHV